MINKRLALIHFWSSASCHTIQVDSLPVDGKERGQEVTG